MVFCYSQCQERLVPTHIYKNPLLSLNNLFSPSPPSLPRQSCPDFPLTLPPHSLPLPLRAPRSILRPFQPSSSLSKRRAFSFSSLRSRSALLACNCAFASSACSSSIWRKSLSTLSRPLATSSESCCEVLSRRASCAWRSLMVRSTLRVDRSAAACSSSWVSSWCSSYMRGG